MKKIIIFILLIATLKLYTKPKFSLTGEEKGGYYFNEPYGLAVSPDSKYLYVANTNNHLIWVFSTHWTSYLGVIINKFGTYGKQPGQFKKPCGIAVDKGNNIYVADTYNHRIQKFDKDGNFIKMWGEKGKGQGQFYKPFGIAIDKGNNIYVADTYNHRIQKFDKDGNFIFCFGKKGQKKGEFNLPYKISIDHNGNIYVADTYNHRIQKFDKDGNFIISFGKYGDKEGEFNVPVNIVVKNNKIYVADAGNRRIQVFDMSFNFLFQIQRNLSYPTGLAVDEEGNIYVSDGWYINKYDAKGKFIIQLGTAW